MEKTPQNTDWKDYEIYIERQFRREYPHASLRRDVRRRGTISKRMRQIDLLIEEKIAGYDICIVVDCKYFNKKVDVRCVESFLGMLRDLKASKGVLITNHGYTKAAYDRAEQDSQDIILEIIDYQDLEQHQGFCAIPYSGNECAVVGAPGGWVIDNAPQGEYIASFYPRGFSQEEAFHHGGFIYMVFSHKDKDWPDLSFLLEKQSASIKDRYQSPEIEYLKTIERSDCAVTLRKFKIVQAKNTIDYTIFLDFPSVVIWLTLLTYPDNEKRYLKKLEWIAQKLIKLDVVYE